MPALFEGMGFGLILAALVGPVFFLLIRESAEKGFKYGALISFGVLFSDTIYIGIAYFGSTLLLELPWFEKGFGLLGGILVIGFGISALLKGKVELKEVDQAKPRIKHHFILQGFLMNSLNPFVFFFWLGAVGMVNLKDEYTLTDVRLFFVGTLFMILTTDLLKSYVAHTISKYLKPEFMIWLNRISGIGLIGFGLSLLWRIA